MDPQELRKKLTGGVIAFPCTPFKADFSVDLPGYRKNLQALLKHPLTAVIAPGGTGEIFSLTPAEHLEIAKATVEEVGEKTAVLAGAAFSRNLGMDLAKEAAKAGVNGILAFPPYYPNADEEGLADYYAGIGSATKLGLLVYSRDWVNPSPAWVEKLAAKIPNLVAWKDGTGDIRKVQQVINRVGDRLHWIGGIGDDQVPGYYSIGIRTYTSSIANVAPKLSLQLHEVASKGDAATLKKLMHDYVIPLYAFRARRRGYEVSVMKEMMSQIGLAAGPCRPPIPDLRTEEKAEVKAMLERWKPVL